MPNKNYAKGRKKEYKIVNLLKERGFDISQRTAGSHSIIDVIAIRKKDKRIVLIQSKGENISKGEIKKLKEEGKWLNNVFLCNFVVK